METKNEALELAKKLEYFRCGGYVKDAAEMLRSQASEIDRLNSTINAQWEDRQGPLKQAELHMQECNRLETERDQLKAKNEKLMEASMFALELLDFIRKGCESGAVKSKPFITPDPDAKSLELQTIHGECVKVIQALKENT